jgi:hypothetical protein
MVNKYIRAFFLLDEAVAFALIKPLHNSISHCDTLLSKKNSHSPKLEVATFDKWISPQNETGPPTKTALY